MNEEVGAKINPANSDPAIVLYIHRRDRNERKVGNVQLYTRPFHRIFSLRFTPSLPLQDTEHTSKEKFCTAGLRPRNPFIRNP